MDKPFQTNNVTLSAALLSAGCAPVDPLAPMLNIYTAKNPFIPRSEEEPDLPLNPGIREFQFVNDEACVAMIRIWDDEVSRIKRAVKLGMENDEPTIEGPTLAGDYPGDIMRLAAWIFHNYETAKNLWRTADAKIWARKKGTPKTREIPSGGTLRIEPGFVLVSRKTPRADLKKMGVVV